MTYDLFTSHCRPWDSYRGSQASSYNLPAPSRGFQAGRRAPRLTSFFSALSDGWERTELALNTETLGVRAREKEQLVGLNDRFATYIEKVHGLEQQNRALRAELEALRRRQGEPSRLQQLYQAEARGLRGRVEAEDGERRRMEERRDYLREVQAQLEERYGEEVRLRQEAEEELQAAREGADRAVVSHCEVEAGVASLAQELLFLRSVFEEERVELQAQLQAASVSLDVDVPRPDLSAALRDIRAQYERLANKNMLSAEEWYRSKCDGVAEMASRNNEAVHAIREETQEYRRLLQSRSSEIETLRNVIGSLHKQLEALEDTQRGDVAKYQARIHDLERDIDEAKKEMARYLKDYQDLLNVKMALDIEIAAYRNLLEGEELRLTSFN